MIRDIHDLLQSGEELNESEKFASKVLAASLSGLYIHDVKLGRHVFINAQYTRLTGYTIEDLRGFGKDRFRALFHPDDRQGLSEHIKAVVRTSGDFLEYEYRFKTRDGRWIWCLSRHSVFARDKDGSVRYIIGSFLDFTERRQSEELEHRAQIELAAQLVKTERINQELSKYVHAVVHDLKAPLRAVRNYAAFLYEDLAGSLTAEQQKYLKGLKRAVAQGNALIDDLLRFAHIGGVSLKSETVDVPLLVSEICALLDLSPEVEIEVQPLWPNITTDRTLLKQILQNLIANGLKFNERPRKRIQIGWQPAPDDHIEIFVGDNGIGIEPQYLDQIFRIFRRLHTSMEYDGTGIGLAIVQEAARRLGGGVRVESTIGEGSTFYLRFSGSIIDSSNPCGERE